MTHFHDRMTASDAEVIWQRISGEGHLSDRPRSILVHDLARMRSRIDEIGRVFPQQSLHTLAIKANPLVEVLREAVSAGAGLEAASLEEVALATAAGCAADRIVFDSPAKTVEEIDFALQSGILLNADNFDELGRIDHILQRGKTRSRIGLRINPLVGKGTISHTSVAGADSKFGVSIDRLDAIVDAFDKYRWLTGLHIHVGSQGCSLEMLAEAVRRIDELRRTVTDLTGRSLEFVDIGGGLPAVYQQDQSSPSPQDYVSALRLAAPELFASQVQLITEFGRSIQAGCGLAFSRVEYVRPEQSMAVIHLGADFLMRPVYRPQDWPHEFFVLHPDGTLKSNSHVPVNIAGPLCFSGDVIARDVLLPPIDAGDWIVIRDVGAYTLGLWSRHCSRGIPAVLGYDAQTNRPLRLLRAAESPADVVHYWSGPSEIT